MKRSIERERDSFKSMPFGDGRNLMELLASHKPVIQQICGFLSLEENCILRLVNRHLRSIATPNITCLYRKSNKIPLKRICGVFTNISEIVYTCGNEDLDGEDCSWILDDLKKLSVLTSNSAGVSKISK